MSGVFAFQFVLRYNPAFVTAQADPPAASDFTLPTCWDPFGAGFPCSENADATVKFGAQTVTGSVNWNGFLAAGRASAVIKIDDPTVGVGSVVVALTLLDPEPAKNISVDTLLANVAFEIDATTPTPISFTLEDVIIADRQGQPISGITTGGAVTWTITNNPPHAAGVVSNLNPAPGVAVTFDATGSTDDVSIAAYVWDFGVGDLDGDGQPETSCNVATQTCTSPTATFAYPAEGTFRATLRVKDGAGATGSARDQLGDPIKNDQPSHLNFTIVVQAVVANNPPVLAAIGAKIVDEETLLSFTATATDPDAGQTLSFSLVAAAAPAVFPTGATINAVTGAFTWTPTEAQGPGTYSVIVRVTDNGSPALSDEEQITITVNEVNVAPVLGAIGAKTADEETLLTFTAMATDADIPANTLTFSLGLGAPSGAAITAAGVFTWTPTEAQGPGLFTVRVIVSDGSLTDFEDVSITVNEVNVAPVLAAIGNKMVDEETLLTFTAMATDADIPANTLTFSLGLGAPAGASITAAGVFTWTATEAQGPGVFSITIVVTDNGSPMLSDSETISVTVNEVNVAPVLGAIGAKSVDELTLLTFTATATDADIPANTLTFSLGLGAPAGAAITTAGVFTWTPTEAQGPGLFTVRVIVSDGSLTDFEDVSITVNEVNVAPVLAAIGNKTVDELTLLTFTATATDADIPANTLTFSLGLGAPSGAAITAAGVFTWTPTEAQGPGVFSVTIVVTDNGSPMLSDSETISVTVNEVNVAPVLAAIGNKMVDELTLLTFTATATDADLPANTLTFSLGLGAPAGAAITTAGVFTWTPTEAQGPGVFSVTIIVTDNGSPILSDSETISITVNEVNVAPVLAAIGNKMVDELTLLTFTATATDADLPANTLTFSLGLGAPAGAAITTGGVFTWTPTEAQGPGVFSVTIIVTDNGVPALSDSETISITVNEVNVAPVLGAIGAKTADEETLLTFTATATDADIPANTLTFSLGMGAPAGAAITTAGVFTWTPTEAQGPGVFTVRVIVSDGSLTDFEDITITVNEVNKPPVVNVPGSQSVAVGNTLTFTVTATDPDIPANTITLSAAGLVAGMSFDPATGVFSFTPTAAQEGMTFIVDFTATDNGTPPLSDTKSVSITVAANNPPVLATIGAKMVDELTLLTFTATATDPDAGQTLTFSLGAGAPSGAAITTAGVFTWTPTEAQGPGLFTVRVIVTDSVGGSDFEDVSITVNEVNVAPVLAAIGNKMVDELTLLTFTATATDADIPANTLTFSLGLGAPAGAAITTAGVFTWTPTEAQGPGLFTVRVIVSDGSLTDFEDVSITVNEVNVAPVLAAIGNKMVDEETLLTFTAMATDADIPANTLTFSLGLGAPAGAAISAGGVFTWTPTEAQGPGSFPVRVIVSDGSLTDFEDITITVNEVNKPPVVNVPGSQSVAVGNTLTFTVTATDPDIPANTITLSAAGLVAGMSFDPATGVFSFTPTAAQEGMTFIVDFTATDNGVPPLSNTKSVSISVTVNNPPVLATIGAKMVDEETLLTFTATATDPDAGQTLTFSLGAGAPSGAAITTAGVFTWTPTEAQGPGLFTVRVIVTDNLGGSDFEDVSITVNEVNKAPVLAAIGNKTVDEETLLTFTAMATDDDIPANTLTFSCMNCASIGASISSGGAFSWTPTEAQGPGVYSVTIVVTDNGSPMLSDSETISITVNEVNVAPVLAAIGNKMVDEETLLTFTAMATDADLPANTLTFSLGLGAPAGAAITAAGVFTWTPTEAQGPGVYSITIVVTDNGSPMLSDSETISVTVNEVNKPPVASFTFTFADTNGNGILDINEVVTFDGTASADPDIPANNLVNFSWSFGDGGTATGQVVTHVYTAGGTFPVTLTVTDDGTPSLSGSASTDIVVNVPAPHARLARWKASPAFHHQDIFKNPTQTLRAFGNNDGEATVIVFVEFETIRDTGPSEFLRTENVTLAPGASINGKTDARFSASFNPVVGSYSVTATIFYSTDGVTFTPDSGSAKTFSFTAVSSAP